jgi:molybdenum cofactor cytidylyltransferase
MRVVAILLAAGASRRFGGPKLHARWRGRPLWEHALAALTATPEVAETVVVVQPGFAAPPAPPRCRFVANPEHAEGMAASLRAGVRAAAGADAFLIAFADMPAVTPALIGALLACYRAAGRPVAVPVCRGRRGHPAVFDASLRDELLAVTGDVGARGLLRAHPEWVAEYLTEDEAVLFDVDAPADLEAGAGPA